MLLLNIDKSSADIDHARVACKQLLFFVFFRFFCLLLFFGDAFFCFGHRIDAFTLYASDLSDHAEGFKQRLCLLFVIRSQSVGNENQPDLVIARFRHFQRFTNTFLCQVDLCFIDDIDVHAVQLFNGIFKALFRSTAKGFAVSGKIDFCIHDNSLLFCYSAAAVLSVRQYHAPQHSEWLLRSKARCRSFLPRQEPSAVRDESSDASA